MEIRGQPVFLYILSAISAVGGFLFGYDTGVVSGAMLMVREDLMADLDDVNKDLWQEFIVTGTIAAAAVFSLVSGYVSQRFGRKKAIIVGSFLFTVGAVVMGAADSKEVLLVGRLIVGGGLGFASSTVPLYIAEVSPESIRGFLTTFNQYMITFGILVSNIVDALFSKVPQGWKYDFGLGGVPSFILFVGFCFCPESPRWLVSNNNEEEARKVLKQIRARNYNIEEELQEIRNTCNEEKKMEEAGGGKHILVRMLQSSYVKKALVIGCLMQLFQQLGGINTVMYYSASIIETTGLSPDQTTIIWYTAAVSAVNMISTVPGMFLIEKLGRRRLTLISLLGIILALTLLTVGFHLIRENSPSIVTASTDDVCSIATSCTACIDTEGCGFCYSKNEALNSCMNTTLEDSCDGVTDLTWFPLQCPSDYGGLVIFALCLYLLCFASGLGPTPWTVNSEIYPLWCRSAGISIATFTNWLANIVISLTYLTLNSELHQWTFLVYAGVSLIGFLLFLLILPETKGKSLEDMEALFSKPLHKLGRAK